MRTSALLAALLLATTQAAASPGTPVIGPCDGCELALRGMPGQPPSESRITPRGQPGKPMRLTGTVTDGSGIPRAGVVVYAHQTDARGEYPGASSANRHGRLRGWARTDASGNYTFLTVRPGAYANGDDPQHVHLFVIEPDCALYYIDDVVFRDDPRLTTAQVQRMEGRGGSGITDPVQVAGVLQVRRDIVLGQGVAGHPDCAPQPAGGAS